MRRIEVGLGDRAYPVLIGPGLLGQAGQLIQPLLGRARTAVVTDETVADLHGQTLTASLAEAGIEAPLLVLPPGEETKSFAHLAELSGWLLDLKLDRGDLIVALGGGVIGDLAGFAASIYTRGIGFIQVPTTLLAQVDSSVGGKTAIDTPQGKNLIGAFHQPRLVLADLDALSTLPARQMRAGYAEVLKYGLLGDFGFFEWLEANGAEALAREPDALGRAVARSVEMKAEIVAEDEMETSGRRALLNLGHTFGHALEAETGFGPDLLHGEAVGAGMAMAFDLSARLGLCPGTDAERVRRHLGDVGLPVRLRTIGGDNRRTWDAAKLIEHMRGDKKAEAGRLTFVLARGIGKAFVTRDVDEHELGALLDQAIAA
jgi:3-dehydroquinate synthase